MEKQNHTTDGMRCRGLFTDAMQRKRYMYALGMILLMVAVAEIVQEKEIVFPEMAALTIGMWIVDKRVWRVKKGQIPVLLTMGALVGVGIVRHSSLPLVVNLTFALWFAMISLLLTRTSLFPLVSASVLPVLLKTESWIYPLSVFIMSLIIVWVQKGMEAGKLRQKIDYEPVEYNWKKELLRYFYLWFCVFTVSCLAVYSENLYFIIPPLLVAFMEFVKSQAGFRNRPVLTVLLLVIGACVGTFFQLVGYYYWGWPETLVALCIFIVLFTLFEWLGKLFAPVGALALIPMLLPQEHLIWLPLQVAIGAGIFIAIGLVFFQQCYKWSRAQLIYCLTPNYLLSRLNRYRRNLPLSSHHKD